MNTEKNAPDKSIPLQSAKFPIVGVGASAGGLEAFKDLLNHLAPDTGMAFVLIQHLSPNYQSFLSEILSRATPMKVIEANDGVAVEKNRVYVIPPNVSMGITNGHLHLTPRKETDRPHLPIDFFFRSLAEDQSVDAIGVVLSGTGSDGAEGLKTIKGEGGISIAQSPDSAKFSGMPERAISVDHVDFILTPEEIAKELRNLSQHPYLRKAQPFSEESLAARDRQYVEKILHLVKLSTGVDFTQYKRTTVIRRIMRRMAVHKVETLAAYYTVMKSQLGEQTALQNDILINVTSFFRNAEVFEKMKSVIFPALLKNRQPGQTIRVWVPGCATGEEVYSIAIVLLEFLHDQPGQFPIQIFGSDVSEGCITKARAGRYAAGIESNVSKERLSRYFAQSDDGYWVSKAVRDLCVFAKHDVLNDPPFSKLDLVSCRNLLIYFESTLQKKVVSIFSYALKPQGFLLLGQSETPNVAPTLFSMVEKRDKIYRVDPNTSQKAPVFSSAAHSRELLPMIRTEYKPDIIERETDRFLATHYAPPSVVINENLEITQFRGETSPYLANQTVRANFQILKMAREGLAPSLKSLIDSVKEGKVSKIENVKIRTDEGFNTISLEAVPLPPFSTNRLFLILFKPASEINSLAVAKKGVSKKAPPPENEGVTALRRELEDSKAYLESLNRDMESTNQDLQSANEEVLSANEELQSTNEELETAKEELQSGNEELTTVNDELQNRNTELDLLNNDLTNLLGNIDIPVLMITKEGNIRRITPAAQKALNLQPSDVGRPILELKSTFEVLGLELNLNAKVAEVVETINATETEIQNAAGRWYRLQIRPYKTLDNRIEGAVVALIDIDALKKNVSALTQAHDQAEKAREMAEAGNRAKDLFLATLSHELRTPLTTILAYAQMLRLGRLNPEAAKKGVLMIEQSALTQAQLINDLLDVSRIIMGKLALDVQDIDPRTILHAAVESVRPTADRKTIRINEKIHTEELLVRGDSVRLKQVFLNLLTNAIKFSDTGGLIEVSLECITESSGDFVRIRVRDFGKGISEKFLPHLFERFSQGDSSSTRSHGGMGLGLAIVRSLMEAQGGSVHAESAGIGKGSAFTILVPAVNREGANRDTDLHRDSSFPDILPLEKKAEEENMDLKDVRILLVDDDPSARDSLHNLLSTLGATVCSADSAQAALDVLSKFKPDVLVSDIAMPGEDGYSLLRRVRNLSPQKMGNLPAIALTAFAGHEDVNRALAAGFQSHLSKPVGSLQLTKAIRDILGK